MEPVEFYQEKWLKYLGDIAPASQYGNEERGGAERIFSLFDADESGTLDFIELRRALMELDVYHHKHSQKYLLAMKDIPDLDQMTFDVFCQLLHDS